MSEQLIQALPATEEELKRLESLRIAASFTAMAGETCDQCNQPMTMGQPFHGIGAVRRIFVCASCALGHMRGGL